MKCSILEKKKKNYVNFKFQSSFDNIFNKKIFLISLPTRTHSKICFFKTFFFKTENLNFVYRSIEMS